MVGSVFGPVILTWFLVIGSLGVVEIFRAPRVLAAAVPSHALSFFVEKRVQVEDLGHGFWRVQAAYGFMQSATVPRIFALAREHGLDVDPAQATFSLSRKIPRGDREARDGAVARAIVRGDVRNAPTVTTFFDIPADRVIEIGTPVEI
jgi:KUP system potassium uptake protein